MRLDEITACGDCFNWAFLNYVMLTADGKTPVLKHAKMIDRWGDGDRFDHAWIEVDGKALDWQTMVAGSSKYAGRGWPIQEFYRQWDPVEVQTYIGREPQEMKANHKHTGPWE